MKVQQYLKCKMVGSEIEQKHTIEVAQPQTTTFKVQDCSVSGEEEPKNQLSSKVTSISDNSAIDLNSIQKVQPISQSVESTIVNSPTNKSEKLTPDNQ